MIIEPHRVETALGPWIAWVDDDGLRRRIAICDNCGAAPLNMHAHRCHCTVFMKMALCPGSEGLQELLSAQAHQPGGQRSNPAPAPEMWEVLSSYCVTRHDGPEPSFRWVEWQGKN